jgi:cyclin-dependent kinase regulatory subunit CKS1
MSAKNIYYSDKYVDEKFEYRHVMLPKDLAKLVPKNHLMTEAEWRKLGVQQSMVKHSDHYSLEGGLFRVLNISRFVFVRISKIDLTYLFTLFLPSFKLLLA